MSSSYVLKIVLIYALVSFTRALTDDTPADLPAPNSNNSPQKGFYQFANVPSPFEYEFGFNVGNTDHYVSRFEQMKNSAFRTMVKWSDSYEGYGEHVFEYNHGDDSGDYSEPSYKTRKPKQLNAAQQYPATPAPSAYVDQRAPFSSNNNKPDYIPASAPAPSQFVQPDQRAPFLKSNNNPEYPVASVTPSPPVYGQPFQRSVATAGPIKPRVTPTVASSKPVIQPKFNAPTFIKYERGYESQAAKRGIAAKRIPTFLVDNNP